ncbi:Endonuclease MutS2 [bacterium HR40]|nr:Endonuclease MutS2 [bacterium HR40]
MKGGDPARRPRPPTAEELALWRLAMRDTRPLRDPPAEPEPEPDVPRGTSEEAPAPRPKVVSGPSRPLRLPGRLDPGRPVDLDRRTWQRLRRGQMRIEGRIDLHGLTQEEAFRALADFLARKGAQGARCVLVITGRGLRSGGILRRMVPHWLETPGVRERVITFAPARMEHGGEGALYVLLRRRAAGSTGD